MKARGHVSEIAKYRVIIEQRLERLLPAIGSAATVAEIKDIVFKEDGHRPFAEYVSEMIDLIGEDGDALLPLLQDAWNFFPHRRLNGRCPAALFLQLSPGKKPRDLRADR